MPEAVNRRRIYTKWTKEKKTIFKTLHRKLKIEQYESHLKPGENPDAPEG